jgi:hypothetical protein
MIFPWGENLGLDLTIVFYFKLKKRIKYSNFGSKKKIKKFEIFLGHRWPIVYPIDLKLSESYFLTPIYPESIKKYQNRKKKTFSKILREDIIKLKMSIFGQMLQSKHTANPTSDIFFLSSSVSSIQICFQIRKLPTGSAKNPRPKIAFFRISSF